MIAPSDPLPHIELPSVDGRQVAIGAQPLQSPVVLAFFKADCPASKVTIGRLPDLARRLPELTVWAVSQDPAGETDAFLRQRAAGIGALIDAPDYTASRACGIDTVPTLVLVGPDGLVADCEVGWDRIRFNALGTRAAELLGRRIGDIVDEGDGPEFRPG